MAQEPLRWWDVTAPQFNTGAGAVATTAFTSAGETARLLAESWRKQDEEKKKMVEKDILNQALAKMASDSKFDENDLKDLPAGLDMASYLTNYGTSRLNEGQLAESQSARVTNAAQARHFDAAAALSQAETAAKPDQIKREVAESQARLTALNAQTGASNEQQGWTTEQRARETEVYRKGVNLEKRLGTYLDWRFGEGENSLLYQADQQFPQVLQEEAAAKAKELGKTTEEIITNTTPEQIAKKKRQHRLNYVSSIMQSEDAPDQVYRATGLTPTEQAELTRDGKNRELDEEALRKSQADLATKQDAEVQLQTEWIKATQQKDFNSVLYTGPGQVSWGPANPIGKSEAEILARTKYDLTDKDKVETVRSLAPNKGAFENALLEITDKAGWTDGSTKRKFSDDWQNRLKVIETGFLSAAGTKLQGPDSIQSGTPVENLRASLQAAWSGLKGQVGEQQQAAPVQEQVAALKEQIIAAKTDINSLVENLPDQLKIDSEVQAQIKSVMEALSGKKTAYPTQRAGVQLGLPTIEPLNKTEIDQRLTHWTEYEKLLREKIKAIQASNKEKDALQIMFNELEQ